MKYLLIFIVFAGFTMQIAVAKKKRLCKPPFQVQNPEVIQAQLVNGIKNNKVKQVEYALRNDADPNLVGPGHTSSLLHFAVFKGNPFIVKALLAADADINALDKKGKTPLDDAIRNNRPEIADILKKKGGKQTVSTAELKIEEAQKSLSIAIGDKNEIKVRKALKDGASVKIKSPKTGNTPLHHAVFVGYIPIVQILLDANSDIHAQNNHKQTPMDKAIEREDEAMADFLKSRM